MFAKFTNPLNSQICKFAYLWILITLASNSPSSLTILHAILHSTLHSILATTNTAFKFISRIEISHLQVIPQYSRLKSIVKRGDVQKPLKVSLKKENLAPKRLFISFHSFLLSRSKMHLSLISWNKSKVEMRVLLGI